MWFLVKKIHDFIFQIFETDRKAICQNKADGFDTQRKMLVSKAQEKCYAPTLKGIFWLKIRRNWTFQHINRIIIIDSKLELT